MTATTPQVQFAENEPIFEEGQSGDTAFVLVTGCVHLVKKGKQTGRTFVAENITQPGTAFGLMPLIDNGPRMMSAIAAAPGTLCEIVTAETLKQRIQASSPFVQNLIRVLTYRLRATTERMSKGMVSTFTLEDDAHKPEETFAHMDLKTFAPGEVLFREGEKTDYAYILESGCVELTMPSAMGRASAELINKQGMLFGFTTLIDGKLHSKTAVATSKTVCTIIDENQFATCMADCNPVVRQTILLLVTRLYNISAQLAGRG